MKNITITSNGSTTKWKEKLIEFAKNINEGGFISKNNGNGLLKRGIHLAIFQEPFLTLLLNGEKSIESRFSLNRICPYKRVHENDLIFIKKSGGAVCGFFIAGSTHYYENPTSEIVQEIKSKYSNRICSGVDKEFWSKRDKSKYISLIEIKKAASLESIAVDKKDRMAWVIIRNANINELTLK